MKKICTIFCLFLLMLSDKNLIPGEPDFPALVINKPVKKNVIDWQWRTSLNNKIYPFLKIMVNQLFFLDSEGDVIGQTHYLPYSKIVTARNQDFAGFIDVDEGYPVAEDRKAVQGLRYHVTSFTGEESYSIPLEVPYDDPIPALYLANTGSSILADGYRGTITIIAAHGTPGEQIDLFEDDLLDYEKPISCAIADGGEMFAVLAQKRPMSFDSSTSTFISGEPYLFCFDFDGNPVLKIPLELMTAAEVAISPSGEFMVVSQYTPENAKKSTVFDRNGEIVLEAPMLFRRAKFFNDESRLALSDRKSIYFMDLTSRSYSSIDLIAENEDRLIVAFSWSDARDALLVLTAKSVFQHSRFEYLEAGVTKLSWRGEKIWELKFDQEKFITPSFYWQQSQLGLGFESNYKIYREQRD